VSGRPAVLLATSLLLAGCGYRAGGRADLLPKTVKTIAVTPFGNVTTRYKLADRITYAVATEFIQRTRYRITEDPNEADAVLNGAVVNYMAYPTVIDPITGRATGVQTMVILQVTLTERASGKVLFTRPYMEMRERYEISVDPNEYFDESGMAMQRLSRDVARSLVSAILENF
jgi:hypothetical protein